ncbi:MAG: type II secretion system protein [Chlamydiae bacterium]|nr:type II secretion system protein [Chlamydiota bacterium]
MKKRKNALTLLEIMIVIALITLVTGVIGYNMRGSLDKGRAFRTEQAIEQVHDLLWLAVSEGIKPADAADKPASTIKKLGLAKNVTKLLQDGWGNQLIVVYDDKKGDFKVESTSYNEYRKKSA